METAAIATVPVGRAVLTPAALKTETEQRKLLGAYIAENMVDGLDYGTIPGTERKDKDGKPTSNKTLLQPGAEKLTRLFHGVPEYTITKEIEDFDRPLFHYVVHCKIVHRDTGAVASEGFGSANSHESKWRWRNQDRTCPNCGGAFIKRSRFAPDHDRDAEPGWYCFSKIGGCGANFEAADPVIADQRVGRVENPDIADQFNTILKIAKKRALVDAAKSLSGASDWFTQDAEDIRENAEAAKVEGSVKVIDPAKAKTTAKPKPAAKAAAKAEQPSNGKEPDEELVNTFIKQIDGCLDENELAAVGEAVKKADDKLTAKGKEHLRGEFRARREELKRQDDEAGRGEGAEEDAALPGMTN